MNIVSDLARARKNPASIQRTILNAMNVVSNGQMDLAEPATPVALLTEAIASVGAYLYDSVEAKTRPLYQSTVTSYLELYRHMTDKDYDQRFFQPSSINILMTFDYQAIVNASVPVSGGDGRRKLTIPRYTMIEVLDTFFLLQYPIDIVVLPHGALTIVFDETEESPNESLRTNRLSWTVVNDSSRRMLALTVPMKQMMMTSQYVHLNSLSSFSKGFPFRDYFHSTRAYTKNVNDSEWTEIHTTHSDIIYDPMAATVLLRVLNNQVVVNVPQIYFTNGKIKTELKVDIFTTKGPLSLNLKDVDPSTYKVTWMDGNQIAQSPYSAPLATLPNFQVFSLDQTRGGDVGKTFEQLRDIIIGRERQVNEPITEINLPTRGRQLGFDIVLMDDNITDRHFVATKPIPAPANKDTVTGLDLGMQLFQTRLTDLLGLPTVKRFGPRVVIEAGTLFNDTAGVISAVSATTTAALKDGTTYSPEGLVNHVNAQRYRINPFHYVIDTSQNRATCNAYMIDKPKVLLRDFVQENSTTGLSLGARQTDLGLNPDGTGYLFAVKLDNTGFPADLMANQLGLQLSYRPSGGNSVVYYDGTLVTPINPLTGRPVDDQWVYYFRIQTNFDPDKNHRMSTSGVSGVLNLTSEFTLVYYAKNYSPPGTTTSDIDNVFKPSELDTYDAGAQYIGCTQERIVMELGVHLNRLWTRIRTIEDSVEYEKYTVDVPAVYPADVLETDAVGNVKLIWDATQNKLLPVKLHSAGDPVRDGAGVPTIAHRAGTFVLDAQRNPIPKGGSLAPIREIDLFLIDGKYAFANDDSTVAYLNQSIDTLVNWIRYDIDQMAGLLYARTRLSYHPKQNLGLVKVVGGDGRPQQMRAEQSLTVTFSISRDNYKNLGLRDSIERETPFVVDRVFANATIAKADIVNALILAFKDSIISARVDGVFGDQHDVITVIDNSVRPTVSKRLMLTRNQTIRMANAVTVIYEPHGL